MSVEVGQQKKKEPEIPIRFVSLTRTPGRHDLGPKESQPLQTGFQLNGSRAFIVARTHALQRG